MKLIIAGGRDYALTIEDTALIERVICSQGVTEVVHGGCRGVDRDAGEVARALGIPVTIMPANWESFGPAAGPRRNRAMAEYADAVLLFPGGKGTDNMHKQAQRVGIKIYFAHV